MKYYEIEPEVAGGLGDRTVIDRSSGKMHVKKLHYQFEGWLGDELLESTPCFIVSAMLASAIEREQLSGVNFDEVEISVSDEFREFFPDRELPKFVWLKAHGIPGKSDFGMTPELNLVVSETALELLKQSGLSHAASITPFLSE